MRFALRCCGVLVYSQVAWRANTDLKIITDSKGSARYATAVGCYSSAVSKPDESVFGAKVMKALRRLPPNSTAARRFSAFPYAWVGSEEVRQSSEYIFVQLSISHPGEYDSQSNSTQTLL